MPTKRGVVEIRFATLSDVPTILRLIEGLAEYEKKSDLMVATEQDFYNALFGEKPCAEALIAYHDGQAVGLAFFFTTFSTFKGKPGLYLEDLFVIPEARSMGVGSRLLAKLAEVATSRNYDRLSWAVLDWNAPAIEFYERIGAKLQDELKIFHLDGEALKVLVK